MKTKTGYLKFSRSFDKGGKAPWLTFYMRNDIEYINEVKAICSKCQKEEIIPIDKDVNHADIFLSMEEKHQKCGLC